MLVRTALPSLSGKCAMRPLQLSARILIPLVAFVAASVSSRADSGGALLKKMVDTYSGASAYTATIVTRQTGKMKDGKGYSLTKTQTIKYKSPNLVHVVVTYKGEGAAAGKVAQGDQTVVADGKILTAYSPSRKQYVKKPDLPKLTVIDLLDVLKKIPTGPGATNVKLVASETIGNRPVNVVEVTPMMPPNLTVDQQKKWKDATAHMSPWRFFIDKQNSSLLRIAESANGGSVEVTLENQLFNSSIPASTFTYTPPAGSKEIPVPVAPSIGAAIPPKSGSLPPPPAHK